MNTSDFNFVFLGQSVLVYRVPLDVFGTINQIYEERINESSEVDSVDEQRNLSE